MATTCRLSRPAFVSAWVALTDSATDNGCLRVVPGSHRTGRVAHGETARSAQNLLTSGMEVSAGVDELDAVDVELKPGEASLHHVDLVHGSRANMSGRPRIGFAIRYVAPDVTQGVWHHPVLLARGRDDHHHFELREPRQAGSLEQGVAAMHRLADEIMAVPGGGPSSLTPPGSAALDPRGPPRWDTLPGRPGWPRSRGH